VELKMQIDLYTGAQLLQDESGVRSLGMVGAFGASNDTGVVRLTLDLRHIAWELDEGSITIDFPEQQARQLAEYLLMVTGRLEHLRVLLRLGHLTPDALLNLSELESLENSPQVKQGD
jgi:hypothetical protein